MNIVPSASARAALSQKTVAESSRETALRPVTGSIVCAILRPSGV